MSSGYDYQPMQGASPYLQLKEKGDSAQIRIGSEPYLSLKVWKESERAFMDKEKVAKLTPEQIQKIMGNPDFTISEVFSWKVIDRTDGKAKIFSASASVYKKIGKFNDNENWGDPTEYDFEIERTEGKGTNFWSVMPVPKRTELTDDEMGMLEDLNIEELVVGARSLEDPNVQSLPKAEPKPKGRPKKAADMDDDEFAESVKAKANEDDVVIEDIDDKPVDLSEIPF